MAFPHDGKKMKKGETLNPNGRPPKILTRITRELLALGYERVKSANVVETYELLLGLDRGRLVEITNDEDQPMIMRIVGKAMLSSKGSEMLEKMIDRAHGRIHSNDKIDITSGGHPVSFGFDKLIKDARKQSSTNTDEETVTVPS